MFYKKGILKTFAKVKEKHLCQSLVFSCLSLQLYSKRDPAEFREIFKSPFLQNTSERLILQAHFKVLKSASFLMMFHFIDAQFPIKQKKYSNQWLYFEPVWLKCSS